jgi:hypothetical protein
LPTFEFIINFFDRAKNIRRSPKLLEISAPRDLMGKVVPGARG